MTTPGIPAQPQWYVQWTHTGDSATAGWHGSLDGPLPPDEAPIRGNIEINGQSYPVATGPYPTKAAAREFITSHPQGPPPDATTNVTLPQVPNPLQLLGGLGWLEEIGHWMGVFVTAVTDLHTYISLGWLLLGAILLILGLLWWFRSTDMGQQFAQTSKETFAAGAAAA